MLEPMSALAVVAALVAALCVGYQLGRRVDRRPPTWKQRTSSAALGRQAVGLIALLAAGRLERSVRRRLPRRRASWLSRR
ncbi:hypothetical protein JN086_22320 [Mycolicibacterium austroafricanum]|jgi:hypothetical protein|nr:hypothetical protein JN090_22400 [Mycolicibacterium austroafricanum]QZT67213.1 hypothetical protein JN086_22320 [Mycolicibacterium austroafricanum]UJL28735.1 hypothetical protein HZU38_28750 [Mycolicibacterium vanbaalenii]